MKRALLVIDVQNEYFTGKLPVSYPKDSLSKILNIMEVVSENKIPVILVQHLQRKRVLALLLKGVMNGNCMMRLKVKSMII